MTYSIPPYDTQGAKWRAKRCLVCGKSIFSTRYCIQCTQLIQKLDKERHYTHVMVIRPWTAEDVERWQRQNQDVVAAHREKVRKLISYPQAKIEETCGSVILQTHTIIFLEKNGGVEQPGSSLGP